jgi:hypothetical protein
MGDFISTAATLMLVYTGSFGLELLLDRYATPEARAQVASRQVPNSTGRVRHENNRSWRTGGRPFLRALQGRRFFVKAPGHIFDGAESAVLHPPRPAYSRAAARA